MDELYFAIHIADSNLAKQIRSNLLPPCAVPACTYMSDKNRYTVVLIFNQRLKTRMTQCTTW